MERGLGKLRSRAGQAALRRAAAWAGLGCLLTLGPMVNAAAEMRFSGVLLNSGEAGASIVDFVGVREAPWAYASDAMDGVWLDPEGNVWAAGAAGVGPEKTGHVYKYSAQGRVLAKYALGPGLWLGSRIAADERYLYFLAVHMAQPNRLEKLPMRLDRTVPPPGPGAARIPAEGLTLIHWSLDQMAGHLYEGTLFVSSNGADPNADSGRILSVDPQTGATREVLSFAPTEQLRTDWVQLIDVSPAEGTVYLMRHIKREGGSGVHGLGDTLCEAYNQQGRRQAGFARMHVYPYLNMCTWTRAGMFTAELVPDARFTTPADELADFTADPNRYLVGHINQVQVDAEFRVYAAGGMSRNVSVFDRQGQPVVRIGALLTTAVAPGPRGELWFLSPQNGLAQGLVNTRSSEVIGRLPEPGSAQPETPPDKVGESYADLSEVRGLVVTPEGWYYRLARRNDQWRLAPNWELRMGTSEGRTSPQQAVGRFAVEDLAEPGQMCLAAPTPGKRALLIPDAGNNRVVSVPLLTESSELSPAPLVLKTAAGANLALNRPQAVAVNEAGCLLIACAQAAYRLKPTGPGEYALEWQATGLGAEPAMNLVAVTPDGAEALLADAGQHRVLRLDNSGRAVEQWGETGQAGVEADRLNTPQSLAVLGTVLYVADAGNLRVVRIALH